MTDWESLCKRCGRCCFERWIEGDGTVRDTRVPCRHLNVVTRACRVYEKRLEVGEGCVRLTPENVPDFHWLPADCAYVEHLFGPSRERAPESRRQRKAGRRRTGNR